MFSSLIRRAQVTVDNAVGQVVNRAIVAIPFLLAAGFATAALSLRLNREFGGETSNLILAGLFAVIGLFAALLLRTGQAQPASEGPLPAALNEGTEDAGAKESASQIDRDLIMAALTSAAPVALPGLMRMIMRNLPLLIAVFAALFVMTRTPDEQRAEGVEHPAAS